MSFVAVESPNSPTIDLKGPAVGECSCAPQQIESFVLREVSDAELERHIASCGYLMQLAYRRYESSHCLGDLGESHRWRLLMEEAIKSRKPAQVARMERARGLNGR